MKPSKTCCLHFVVAFFLFSCSEDIENQPNEIIVEDSNTVAESQFETQVSIDTSAIKRRLSEVEVEYQYFEELDSFASEFYEIPDDDQSKMAALELLIDEFVDPTIGEVTNRRYIAEYIMSNGFAGTEISSRSREGIESILPSDYRSISDYLLQVAAIYQVEGINEIVDSILSDRIFVNDSSSNSNAPLNYSDLTSREWTALKASALLGNEVSVNSIIVLTDRADIRYKSRILEQLAYVGGAEITDYLERELYSDETLNSQGVISISTPIAWSAAKSLGHIYRYDGFPVRIDYEYVDGSEAILEEVREWIGAR
ncbi:MAG: hypothetical protein GKR91_12000 [Pseudomonadales bacterium]|nr:hypothetical protein [Pseudomonadales bacterium]